MLFLSIVCHLLRCDNRESGVYNRNFYCLWLSELTMGFEVTKLEKIGVGGLFHFCFQTNKKEGRQQPSVFIFSVPDIKKKAIYNYMYRVTFVERYLVEHY